MADLVPFVAAALAASLAFLRSKQGEMERMERKFQRERDRAAAEIQAIRAEMQKRDQNWQVTITALDGKHQEMLNDILTRQAQERAASEARRAADLQQYQDQIMTLQKSIKKLKETCFADGNGDPRTMKVAKDRFYQAFLKELPKIVLCLSDKFPHASFSNGEKHVAFIGDVSVGKSSILNAFFNLKLPAGSDHTTKFVHSVCKVSNVVFWDTPGQNTDEQLLLTVESVQVLNAMDLIVIMYTSDLNTVTDICSLVKALNRPVALVRMKADLIIKAAARGEEPLAHFVAKDQQRFPDWPVFACSAWDPSGTENDRFKRFLLDSAGPSQAARR
jgi:small GTP-binding protein